MPIARFFTRMAPDLASLITACAPPSYDVTVHPIDLPVPQKRELLQDADFLILFPGVIEDEVIRAGQNVKLIQLVSAGFDRVNVDLCRELGIPVANNGGANAIDVAEHTVALILAYYRRMVEMDANVRHNRWSALDSGATTYTIEGKTVGIVGLGNIGQRTARLLRAFGAELLYSDAVAAPAPVEQDLGVKRVELSYLLQYADVVTLHVPLNEHTRGLIGSRELGMMKPTALLVNTCRGPVVDESALIDALRNDQIRGAALDVLEKEPPDPDNQLLAMANVLFTPHTAGVTYDTWQRRGEFIFENLQRVWRNEAPLARVA